MTEWIKRAGEVRKALAAFLVPALTALGVALTDGTITAPEWVGIGIAALGTSGVVYAIRNEPQAQP